MTVGLPVMMSLILSTLDLGNTKNNETLKQHRPMSLRHFFPEGSFKQLDQQILLTVILSIVEYGENDVLHKTCCLALRHFKNQFGKITRISL